MRVRSRSWALLGSACLLALAACPRPDDPFVWGSTQNYGDDDDGSDDDDDATPQDPDADGDGYPESVDCNDQDPNTWPGAPELCDLEDNDCDGETDEEPLANISWYLDNDGDGYGVDDVSVIDCAPVEGYSSWPGDCDDDNPAIHPGALIDGFDADCDGRREWRVEITITVVDSYQLCVDDEENILGSDNQWENAETYSVWLDSGSHVVGFHGEGSEGEEGDDLTGAIVVIALSNGTEWWTNTNWRYDSNPEADDESREGWCSPDFDVTGWGIARDYGSWGVPPWGAQPPELSGTPASWIWDNSPVDHKSQYFRLPILLP